MRGTSLYPIIFIRQASLFLSFFLYFEKAAPMGYGRTMDRSYTPIPWNTPALWQEANFALCHAVERHPGRLMDARRLAIELRHEMLSIVPLMERLCSVTCALCQEVCCLQACVWMDYKDLVFLHLTGIQIPEAQPLNNRGECCRYLGPKGCRLDRIQRPFICTWYLCPSQTQCIRENPAYLKCVSNRIQQVKSRRKEMEYLFIKAIV